MHNHKNMNKRVKTILTVVVIIFAIIGFAFTSVFIAMQFGLLNVRGTIDERNNFFNQNTDVTKSSATNTTMLKDTDSKISISNATTTTDKSCVDETKDVCEWNETREWEVVKGGLIKDKDLINRVAKETDVSPRLLAAIVVPEQTRFFTAEREVFKRYFEPLKILGSLSKFSLGISGIKQETAMSIEKYANDPNSQFFPGVKYSAMIAYPEGVDKNSELYKRLTDAKNHYYSYLYTAIFIKEIEAQWKSEGYNIERAPGATITLFNLGFAKSHPNPKPTAGGAPITTGGKSYPYGELGLLFYNSNELSDVFPR